MKEASGELSMTAIAVVAIGGIAVIFTTLVLPSIKKTIERNSQCSQAFNCGDPNSNGIASCSYLDDDGTVKPVQCSIGD